MFKMECVFCVILQIFFLMNTYVNDAIGICSKVKTCPSNKQKWTERGKELKCTGDSSYHCIFVVDRGLCELCYVKFTIQKEYSGCPVIEWNKNNNAYFPTDNIECSVNLTGCPPENAVYFSDEVYRFPLCTGNNVSAISNISTDSTVTSPSHQRNTGDVNVGVIIGVICGIISVLLVIIIVFVIVYRKRKERHQRDERKKEEEALLSLENASFIENLRATFRKSCWILRCKVSCENADCKWYRMREQEGYSEVNDGDGEIRIREEQKYHILEVPQTTGLDGTYKCELRNGKSVEINLDFNQTDITMTKVGETCTFIRMLDETHKQCEWYKGDDHIESDEHFRIDNENNQSRLIIMNIQSIHSQSSFHSKIGEEIQFHGIYVEESSDMIGETDQKTYGNSSENETVADGTLSPLTDDGQPPIVLRPSTSLDTSSKPAVRKVVDESIVSKRLDELFHKPSWEKLADDSESVARHLEELSTISFEEEILGKMNDLRRSSTRICKEDITDIHTLLKSITRAFENVPNQSEAAMHREHLQKPSIFIDLFHRSVQRYKEESGKAKGDLKKTKEILEEKILSIEKEPKCKKLHEDKLGEVIMGLQSINMYFDSICDILTNMECEVYQVDDIFQSVASHGQHLATTVTINIVRERFHSFHSIIKMIDGRFITIDSRLHEVYKQYGKIVDQSLNDGDDNGSAKSNRDVCMAESAHTLLKY